MTPEQYLTVEKAFDECLNAHNEAERLQILDRLGKDNPELCKEVESLLAHDTPTTNHNMEVGIDSANVVTFEDNLVGETIGSYKILKLLAIGGMGQVYQAQQEHLRRLVALKVLRRELMSKKVWQRFELECQILANLRHRGIAQIIESGTYKRGGREYPFYTMELVPDAKTIFDYANTSHLNTDDRLRLMIEVCEAVYQGHLKGIMHRDLKPANILVDPSGQPKIIDFGVARVTNSDIAITTMDTEPGQLIGTLSYMSPEQCEGNTDEIDVRADVYALGIILYELLCGRLPYEINDKIVHEAVRIICDEEPTKLSTVSSALRGDIETIVRKAIKKEKERRYQSAMDLANDISRYLKSEPIIARPQSSWYQLSKFTKRNKALVGGVVAIIIGMIIAIVGISIGWYQTNTKAIQYRISKDSLNFITKDLLGVVSPYELGKNVMMIDVLDAASEKIGNEIFKDDPLVEAMIRNEIGLTYLLLGTSKKAIPHLETALKLREDNLGINDRLSLLSVGNLSSAYNNAERPADAVQLCIPALARAKTVLAPDDNAILIIKANLGHAYFMLGRYDDAEPIHIEVANARRRITDENHEYIIRAISNLGSIYSETGRFAEADKILAEADELAKKYWPEIDRPERIFVIRSIAHLRYRQQRFQESVDLYESIMDDAIRVFGADNEEVVAMKGNLATNYKDLGQPDKAIPLFLETIEISKAAYGADSHYALFPMFNLAEYYYEIKRYTQAETIFNEIVELGRNKFSGHPLLGAFMAMQGTNLIAQNRYHDAEPVLLEALTLLDEAEGQFAEYYINGVKAIVNMYENTGRISEADKWLAKLDG